MSDIFKGSDAKKKKEEKELKELYSKWTKEQEYLLAEWAEKASCYRWLHGRAEKKYRRSNYAYTIPVIIMSTLTGTANFAMDSFVPEEHKKIAMAAVGGVNILAGIISTLQNFLRYAELMESHRSSGVSWSKLGRDITIELALDPPRRKPARDFLNICRAEYDRLIEQSPLIDDIILKQFHSKFHDSDINKPEMCNGLDKCEIYKPSKEEKTAEILANVTTKMSNHKKRMFTIDKPPVKYEQSVENNSHPEIIKSSVSNIKNENKNELEGLANLGRVSRLKNNKSKSRNLMHNELVSVLDGNQVDTENIALELEGILPKTPTTISVKSNKSDIEKGIIEDTIEDTIEDNSEDPSDVLSHQAVTAEDISDTNDEVVEKVSDTNDEVVEMVSDTNDEVVERVSDTNNKESQTDENNIDDKEDSFLKGILDE